MINPEAEKVVIHGGIASFLCHEYRDPAVPTKRNALLFRECMSYNPL
jgi:hypothetical protein